MYILKSIYSNLLFRDKVPLLQEMLDSTLDPGDSGQAMDIELVANLVLTKKRRLLYSWEKKLEEREDFLAAIPYGVDSYEMLDKMMGGTDGVQAILIYAVRCRRGRKFYLWR